MLVNELQHEHQAPKLERAEVALLWKELAELRALVGQGRGAEAVILSATVAANGTDFSPRYVNAHRITTSWRGASGVSTGRVQRLGPDM